MLPPINYTKLVKDDARIFLYDENASNFRMHKVEDINTALNELREALLRYDYPVTRDWIDAIVKDGADGLRERIVHDNESEAVRLKVPRHVAEQWKRSAVQEAPRELWDTANLIMLRIRSLTDGLPLTDADYIETPDKGVQVDAEAVRAKVDAGCTVEVSTEMQKQADTILTIAKTVREMEMAGVNCLELVGKYARSESEPETLTRYRDIVLRRHMPGVFTPPDIQAIMAMRNNL